jgi:bacterioferritin-associated ferredoxin
MEVMYSQIVEEIRAGITTYNGLSERLGVGTGCSSCVDEVKQILQETLEGE